MYEGAAKKLQHVQISPKQATDIVVKRQCCSLELWNGRIVKYTPSTQVTARETCSTSKCFKRHVDLQDTETSAVAACRVDVTNMVCTRL